MISSTSRTLHDLLVAEMSTITAPDQVALRSPAGLAGTDVRLTVFLYAVIENPHLKTEDWFAPPGSPGVLRRPPLTVDLYYLLTAVPPTAGQLDPTDSTLSAQDVLADAMRALYETGTIRAPRLSGNLAGTDAALRVTLNPITVEDMTRIWGALPAENLQTSVSYLVSPVPIVPNQDINFGRVVDREQRVGQRTEGATP